MDPETENDIGADGAAMLARALRVNKSLANLDLSRECLQQYLSQNHL